MKIPIAAPPRVDSSKGPPRKIGKILTFFAFFRPTQKMVWDGPKWGREVLFPTNPDLADILGRMDFDFENFLIFGLFGSNISRFPRFPDFRKIGPYSSGDHFSESCSPRTMMQNGIDEIFWGRPFKNTFYFNLRTLEHWPRSLVHSKSAYSIFAPQD